LYDSFDETSPGYFWPGLSHLTAPFQITLILWVVFGERSSAAQQSVAADVRFGPKADIGACPLDVRFTPKSGHCAYLFDHLVGRRKKIVSR
jgi:hypothetical protein